MKKITTLLLAILMVLPAIAATIPAGTKLYLTPNSNWKADNARFAAYFFGNGEAWVSMTKVEGETDLYELTSPSKSYSNVIFCRMNPSTTANNWSNKWNQTSDLVYDGTNNHYTVKAGTWDKGGGTWSYYGTSAEVMVGLSIAPEKIFEGDVVTFSANVVNVEGDYTTTFYVDDAAIEGATWTATAGDHTAYVEVTHAAGVNTSDKENFKVEAITSSFNVYLDKSTAYATTYIYSWDANGANPSGSWPGTEMTETEVVEDVEYLKYTFRNVDVVSIIFTDNNGNQTKDITGVSKDTYYQLNSTTGNPIDVTVVTPGEVVEPETPETLVYKVTVPAGTPACYIVGEFNEWAAFEPMTMVDETHYTITIENVTKSMGYKYTCGEAWEYEEAGLEYGQNRTWNENDVVEAWKAVPGTEDPEPETPETLVYNVTVPVGTIACYIAGDFNEWTFTAMEMVDATHFTITLNEVTKSMKYKYTCGDSWEYVEMQADGVTDVVDRTWNENDVVEAWAKVWTGVAGVVANDAKVYGSYNAIHVSTTQATTLNIYNAQGMLVTTTMVDGDATISLAPGMYIVNRNKVLVY